MNVEQLLARLASLPSDLVLRPGFVGFHSWRGNYSCVAYKPGEATVAETAKVVRESVGQAIYGYKGGTYTVGLETDAYVTEDSGAYDGDADCSEVWWARVVTESTLGAEIAKLRAERKPLLALLKAAREHHKWCLYSLEMHPGPDGRDWPIQDFEEWEKKNKARWDACNLGPSLAGCEGIETP